MESFLFFSFHHQISRQNHVTSLILILVITKSPRHQTATAPSVIVPLLLLNSLNIKKKAYAF